MTCIANSGSEEILKRPDGVIGPFKPVSESDIDLFNDFLADEIDSALALSIRCCEGCYKDFETKWPGTTFRNTEFQNGRWHTELIVNQSRLPGFYSPAELSTYQRFVRCPRCEQYIEGWVWVHEHEAADKFESDIERLGKVSQNTPFLILDDPFARRVFDEIRTKATTVPRITLPGELFRARAVKQKSACEKDSLGIEFFGPPPADLVVEGRFNHAGLPMLYLAENVETVLSELGSPGDKFFVSALEITGQYRILDLIVDEPDEPEFELLGAIAASALVAAPRRGSGWVKKEYVFTRFVADCALRSGFDCIRYASTKNSLGNNYVLLKPSKKICNFAKLNKVDLLEA